MRLLLAFALRLTGGPEVHTMWTVSFSCGEPSPALGLPERIRVGVEIGPMFGAMKMGVGHYVTLLIQAMGNAGRELWLYWRATRADARRQRPSLAPNMHARAFNLPVGWMTVGLPVRALIDRLSLCHFPSGIVPYRFPVPAIVTGFDLTWHRMAHLFEPALSDLLRAAYGVSMRRADHVIAVSECTRRDLMGLYGTPPDRITVVPLAPDPLMRPLDPQVAAATCTRYDLTRPYLLYVGSFYPNKNLPSLLRAYHAAFEARADRPQLILVGPPSPREALEALMASARATGLSDHVRYLGYVPRADMPALYSGALAFVFPSLYEGFGLPPLEAMACGTPVVCSKAASLPEVVGDAALVFDPADEDEISAALARIVADESLREDLAGRGLARSRHFSWERTASETWAVYERVIGERRR
jgi:glycosyltransferase involved in cell wall biosynthesis